MTFASTRPTQKPTIMITSKECTKPSLAFGCACLERAKKTQNLLSTTSKWRSIRRYMKMFPVLSATNPLEQDEIWRGIWKMSTRQEISMKRQGTQTDHTRTKIWMMIQLILTTYHFIWHSLLMTDATNKSFRLYQDILEAPRFYRQPRSLKFGYFCELNSTGASEVLWEPQR